METRMRHISIYWKNDSDELLEMMDALGDPGETVGNDGAEIAVTDSEYEAIVDYAAEHPEITVEHHDELTPAEARQAIEDWKALR